MDFKWVSYILAIGVWNTVFTGIIVCSINILRALSQHPSLSKFEVILTFLIGYLVLFLLNVKIIDEN